MPSDNRENTTHVGSSLSGEISKDLISQRDIVSASKRKLSQHRYPDYVKNVEIESIFIDYQF